MAYSTLQKKRVKQRKVEKSKIKREWQMHKCHELLRSCQTANPKFTLILIYAK